MRPSSRPSSHYALRHRHPHRAVGLPWQAVRESVEVKLHSEDGGLQVLARSRTRIAKERGTRQRRLKKQWARLHDLRGQTPERDQLLLKLGAAKKDAGRA